MKSPVKLFKRTILVFSLLCCIPFPLFAQDETNKPLYLPLPIAGRLAGIGGFYGLGVDLQNIASTSIDVTAAKTAGRIDASGALVRDLNLGDIFSFSGGYVAVDKFYFDVSYTRGVEVKDDPVTQVGGGTGSMFNIFWKFLEPGILFNTSYAVWNYKFDEYLTHEEEKKIETPSLHLGDLNTTFVIGDLVFNLVNDLNNPTSGFLVGLNTTSMTTNTEFSSTNTANYYLNAYLPVLENHTWVFRGFGSDTVVTNEKTTDVDEIKSKLNMDCDSVTDSDKRTECESLRDGISGYLAAHNRYGTATPMGGNKMLRSYREMRYRGAHTRFLGTELRFNFPADGLINNYQFAVFFEKGTAVDDMVYLDKEYKDSFGAAIRIKLGQLTVRLEGANGDEGQEWFLIASKPW